PYAHRSPCVKDGADATRTSSTHRWLTSAWVSTVSAATSFATRSVAGPSRTVPPATRRSSTPAGPTTMLDTFGARFGGSADATCSASAASGGRVVPGAPGAGTPLSTTTPGGGVALVWSTRPSASTSAKPAAPAGTVATGVRSVIRT